MRNEANMVELFNVTKLKTQRKSDLGQYFDLKKRGR